MFAAVEKNWLEKLSAAYKLSDKQRQKLHDLIRDSKIYEIAGSLISQGDEDIINRLTERISMISDVDKENIRYMLKVCN
jgi:demethoxyubiquinone hydroxylase (CLK1/Coq7/Cat5 family)